MEIFIDHDIILKQIHQSFAEELFTLVYKNFEGPLCYWCPDLKKTYNTLQSTRAHIDDAISKFNEDQSPDFLIVYKGKIAGLISLSPVDQIRNTSEIGYWLGAEFESLGLVSRCFPFIMTYAKNTLGLKAVQVSTAVPNTRSQKLPLKFNFDKMNVVPNAEILQDGPVDHIIWRYEF